MELPSLLSRIDQLKSEIDALRPINKELEQRIMQKFRLDWNYHSNHIEGNSLTYGETKTFLLHGLTAQGKPLKDHLDIKGHNEGIHALEDIIKNKRPLTETFIRQLHEVILPEPYETPAITAEGLPTTKKITPGKYKTQPNHVKTVTDETFFFASPEETPAKMEELMKWYNTVVADPGVHPLIIASELHYRFVRIHPFDDGNGRMARLLMNLVFMMKGFPPVVIKTEKKEEYYRALQQADGGNFDAFVQYIGEQLTWSLDLFLKGAKGERIDEDGDIDKELALFKASLTKETRIKTKKNNDSVEFVLKNVFVPLLDKLILKLESLNELFFENRIDIIIDGKHNSEPLSKADFHLKILNETNRPETLRDLEFIYTFSGYVKPAKHVFDTNFRLKLTFNQFEYLIYLTNDQKKIIAKAYGEILTNVEVEDIIKRGIKDLIETIKDYSE